ncbi:MAG: rhomboid family intramembrane serine protease [Planctomycetes bacterium]|nr:rhomboid family intramembrane serine protease [Planctomycetota bacterium]
MNIRSAPLEKVYRCSGRRDCSEYALVLRAAGIDYLVQKEARELTLVVAAEDAARARAELDAYARENVDQHVHAETVHPQSDGWLGVFGYVAVVVLVTYLDHQNTFAADWSEAGKTQAGLIRDGQWWRVVTALTLHADLFHLLSNVVFGSLFGLFAGQMLGSGLAWASILAAGAMGNLLNALIRHGAHTSVGASTAVFAALGLVAGYAWKRRSYPNEPKLARWAPLVGAVVLLSYLGTGGVRTDVAAHVMGFLSGMLLGAIYGKLGSRIMFGPRMQVLLGLVAVGVLAVAWAVALSSNASLPGST